MPKILKIAVICLTASLFLASPARTHRINLFCWTEKGQISCEASFSGDNPVQGGKIEVRQKTGTILVSGKTDKQGAFSFSAPQEDHGDLKVAVDAGMGHKSTWTIEADEYLERGEPEAKNSKKSPREEGGSTDRASNTDKQDLRAMIQDVLNKELAPVKKELAGLRQSRTTLQDIISGIGYILGLMGIALYFKSKRR